MKWSNKKSLRYYPPLPNAHRIAARHMYFISYRVCVLHEVVAVGQLCVMVSLGDATRTAGGQRYPCPSLSMAISVHRSFLPARTEFLPLFSSLELMNGSRSGMTKGKLNKRNAVQECRQRPFERRAHHQPALHTL